MRKYLGIFFFIFCSIGGLFCSRGLLSSNDGGGIETVAIAGRAVYDGNSPAAHCRVLLRPQNYLKDTAGPTINSIIKTNFDTQTDDSGYFEIDSVSKQLLYALEINDGNLHGSFLRGEVSSDSTVQQAGTMVLRTTGSIVGTIDSSASNGSEWYARIYGLERAARLELAKGTFTLTDVPEGTYSLQIVSSSPQKPPITHDSIIVSSGANVLLPCVVWQYSRRMSLNTTPSGADVAGNVTGFPVLIRLTSSNFNFTQARADGGDLRFAKSDNTPLSYEIERFDPATEHAEVWVRVDTVYGNDSAQFIVMYWGASTGSATAQSNGAAVFDTANGFDAVWHMNENPAAGANSIKDRTANGYDATPGGNMNENSVVDGAVGKGLYFDGAADFVDAGLVDLTGNYSIGLWVNTVDLTAIRRFIWKDASYTLWYDNGKGNGAGAVGIRSEHSANGAWRGIEEDGGITQPMVSGRWFYLSGTYDGDKIRLYVNGVLATTTNSIVAAPQASSYHLFLSRVSEYVKGTMDEVRIENTARSADWIKLCYMNQRSDDQLVKLK